jgi:hypothetical protein
MAVSEAGGENEDHAKAGSLEVKGDGMKVTIW